MVEIESQKVEILEDLLPLHSVISSRYDKIQTFPLLNHILLKKKKTFISSLYLKITPLFIYILSYLSRNMFVQNN